MFFDLTNHLDVYKVLMINKVSRKFLSINQYGTIILPYEADSQRNDAKKILQLIIKSRK